ncbi:MAG: ATP-binding protein [Acidobacteria bacterium]|nr:ATP-binding protein [Acidobacteriota bacterium]
MVITVDDEALDFVLHHAQGMFDGIPLVYCGITPSPLIAGLPRERATGVLESDPTAQLLRLALSLHPGTRHLYVVVDKSPQGISVKEQALAAAQSYPRLTAHILDGAILSVPEILEQLKAAPPGGLLLMNQFRLDRADNYVGPAEAEYAFAAAANMPVYGAFISQVGRGILAGTPNGGFDHGTLVAGLALRVLNGEPLKSIPQLAAYPLTFVFDYAEMQRWGIDESALPAKSQIRNRPASTWRDYGPWLAGIALFLTLQALVIFALSRNILQRRLAQAKLNQALKDLSGALELSGRAAQMKDRFVANISHELRTPMNGVLGMLQALQDTPLVPQQRDSVNLATRSARSLLTILNDILDFSRMEAGKLTLVPVEFSLRERITELTSLLRPSAAPEVMLESQVADDVPDLLRGDAGRLHQVLMNLTANALKFTARGRVSIRVECTGALPVPPALSVTRGGDEATNEETIQLRFVVADSGIGIAADQISRLFKPFSQVDDSSTRRFGGTGLGLAISRQLVERMGGTIQVQSEVGLGSTFVVELPLEVLNRGSAPVALRVRPRFGGRKVLVVEDNPINRVVAQRLLERTGCEVAVAVDGLDGLAMVTAAAPDLVLMDVQMPGMSGLEATREIRRLPEPACKVPIVAMTASSMTGDRERCLESGMNDYLSKPLELEVLEAVVARWLLVTDSPTAN